MIDIHFHCLPGIDDGPRNWEEAIALCRAAESDGVDTIVATPHVLRDGWLNEDPNARHQLLLELNTRLGGHPAVLPGCEYFFSSSAVELWQMGNGNPQSATRNSQSPLIGLNRSSYLLVEFPATHLPEQAEAVFHEMSLLDVKPIIAHPERNLVFAEQPEKLARFVELGASAQITAGSVTGSFGKAAQAACDNFLRRGLVHLVASDAHSVNRRPPELMAARQRMKQQWGNETEAALFDANPKAVVADQPIPRR